jgi:uncharacterized repeat protein (TIGR03803 family)
VNVLYSFGGYANQDGGQPQGKLIFDNAGNLYGTTVKGGANGYGTVFELSPDIGGNWSESVLYNFCSQESDYFCLDGSTPESGLVFDSAGNLYGTTSFGGALSACGTQGCGTVFELSPPAQSGGTWTYSIIYNFCTVGGNGSCLDGEGPYGRLTFDPSGNLYGTTTGGGTASAAGGVVFELSPGPNGWTETVLHSFCSSGKFPHCLDGDEPVAGVSFDKSGNLYGTTTTGGSSKYPGGGVVYKLSNTGNGWAETVVASFLGGRLGGFLMGEVNFDPQGNLYSTANLGGQFQFGTAFRIDPSTKKILTFSFNNTDGAYPAAGVLIDPKTDALYGTVSGGPAGGAVYKIVGGTESIVSNVGGAPESALITDKAGNLYGTTTAGGDYEQGTVYEIIP